MILMQHKEHGFHNILPMDEEAHIKNGWFRVEETKAEETSLEDQYFKKYGKYPHHRMKPESIKDALKE